MHTDAVVAAILRLFKSGRSRKEIAAKFGLPYGTVGRIIRLRSVEGNNRRGSSHRTLQQIEMRLRAKVIKLEKMLKASVHVIRAMEPSPMKRGLLGPAIQAKFTLSREAVNSLIGSASGSGRGQIPPEVRKEIVGDMERYFAQNPGHGFRMVFKAILVGQPYRRVPLNKLYREVREKLGSGRQRSIRKIETPLRIRKPMAIQGALDNMWSMDYMTDVTTDGKRFWILNIVDDFNRETLVSAVSERISTKMVVQCLNALKDSGRVSTAIRTDNGMEFKGKEYIAWASKNGVERVYSRPRTPTDNVLVERLNQTLRHEVLDRYLLTSLEEASRMIEDWRVRYNLARPHASLGGLSPLQFAALNAPATYGLQPLSDPSLLQHPV